MELKCSIIDNIKKEYEYKLESFNFIDTAVVIYGLRFAHFELAFERYEFEEKVKEIKTLINKKKIKFKKIY